MPRKSAPAPVAPAPVAPAPVPVPVAPAPVAPEAKKGKKAPNVWMVFTARVEALLKTAKEAASPDEVARFQGPATMSKQFASALKDEKPYDEWTDEEIVARFKTWERPAKKEPKEPKVKGPKEPKVKKEPKEPKAKKEPKEPTPWQHFLARVRGVLSGEKKPPVMKFAAALKAMNPSYDTWTDAQILAEFRGFTPSA